MESPAGRHNEFQCSFHTMSPGETFDTYSTFTGPFLPFFPSLNISRVASSLGDIFDSSLVEETHSVTASDHSSPNRTLTSLNRSPISPRSPHLIQSTEIPEYLQISQIGITDSDLLLYWDYGDLCSKGLIDIQSGSTSVSYALLALSAFLCPVDRISSRQVSWYSSYGMAVKELQSLIKRVDQSNALNCHPDIQGGIASSLLLSILAVSLFLKKVLIIAAERRAGRKRQSSAWGGEVSSNLPSVRNMFNNVWTVPAGLVCSLRGLPRLSRKRGGSSRSHMARTADVRTS